MMRGFLLRGKVRSTIYIVLIVLIAALSAWSLMLSRGQHGPHPGMTDNERNALPMAFFAVLTVTAVLVSGFLASLKQIRPSANPSVDAVNRAANRGIDSDVVLRTTGEEKAEETRIALETVRITCPQCGAPGEGVPGGTSLCGSCGFRVYIAK